MDAPRFTVTLADRAALPACTCGHGLYLHGAQGGSALGQVPPGGCCVSGCTCRSAQQQDMHLRVDAPPAKL
jgi:hypothetical protein